MCCAPSLSSEEFGVFDEVNKSSGRNFLSFPSEIKDSPKSIYLHIKIAGYVFIIGFVVYTPRLQSIYFDLVLFCLKIFSVHLMYLLFL